MWLLVPRMLFRSFAVAYAHFRQSIEYSKKKDKMAQIKFIKDETVAKDDLYKSHTVHVASGEPQNSVSRPPAKRKPGVVRPITQGKLLKAGGPSDVRFTGRFEGTLC